jgi:hypothetical protein
MKNMEEEVCGFVDRIDAMLMYLTLGSYEKVPTKWKMEDVGKGYCMEYQLVYTGQCEYATPKYPMILLSDAFKVLNGFLNKIDRHMVLVYPFIQMHTRARNYNMPCEVHWDEINGLRIAKLRNLLHFICMYEGVHCARDYGNLIVVSQNVSVFIENMKEIAREFDRE